MLSYRILYFVCFLFYLPKLLYEIYKKRNSCSVQKKLFPEPIPQVQPGLVIWVHAVSLGEMVAVTPVIIMLLQAHPKSCLILSHATDAGLKEGKEAFPHAHAHLFLPFECRALYLRLLKNLPKIDLLIYSEGDVWPLFTSMVKEKGAFVSIVNGKISEKTFSRYMKFPFLARFVFQDVDLFCLQNTLFKTRYHMLGIPDSKLIVTKNTKADRDIVRLTVEQKQNFLEKINCVETSRPIVVLASTHDPEEIEIIKQIVEKKLIQKCRVILVPRHSYRFSSAYQSLKKAYPQLKIEMFTYITPHSEWDILIMDTMGQLMNVYQVSDLAVVCGSFVPHIGGHNILEPASLRCPFFVGPYMHSQPYLYDEALAYDALQQYKNYQELVDGIDAIITDQKMREIIAEKVYLWAQSMRGAVQKTYEALSNKAVL